MSEDKELKIADNLVDAFNNFNIMGPLPAGSSFYVHRDINIDPTSRIKTAMLNSLNPDKILFTGHRGIGKSTELIKLSKDVEINKKLLPVYLSIEKELDIQSINYTDILIVIGSRIFDEAKKIQNLDEKLIESLYNWADKITIMKDVKQSTDVGVEAGVEIKPKMGLDAIIGFLGNFFISAKGGIRSSFEKREEIRKEVEPRLSDLIVRLNDIIREIRIKLGKELLILIDDLEKIPDLRRSIELFRDYGRILTQPDCKMIFTFPISLYYSPERTSIMLNFTDSYILPNFHLFHKDEREDLVNINAMRSMVLKRIDQNLIEDMAILDELVKVSGGIPTELMRLMRDASLSALHEKENKDKNKTKISKENLLYGIKELRRIYSSFLTREGYRDRLKDIMAKKNIEGGNNEMNMELLHSQCVLYHINDEEWYDVHPILKPKL